MSLLQICLIRLKCITKSLPYLSTKRLMQHNATTTGRSSSKLRYIAICSTAIISSLTCKRFDEKNKPQIKPNIKPFDCLGVKSILSDNSLHPGIPNFNESSKWLRENYIPTDNEIWIITYTKCGTTLTQQICHEIMHCYYMNNGKKSIDSYYAKTNGFYSIFEWIEAKRASGLDAFNKHLHNTNNTKRIWKTHARINDLPCTQLPKKMIIVCRNPKDALVSYYYHVKNAKGTKVYDFKYGFKELFMIWSLGLMEGNSYFTFYKEYLDFYNLNKDIDILWLNYEDLVESDDAKKKQINKLIRFIGVEEFVNTDRDINNIMMNTSVIKMKKQYENYVVKDFVRKGVCGDWKNHFNDVQNTLINGLIDVTFNDTEFKYYKDLKDKKEYICFGNDDI
eukprot:102881_1